MYYYLATKVRIKPHTFTSPLKKNSLFCVYSEVYLHPLQYGTNNALAYITRSTPKV